MKFNEILSAQLATTHTILARTLADCDETTLHYIAPGGTVGSIASTYAHVAFAEDRIINATVRGGATVYESQGWAKKLGVAMPDGPFQSQEWATGVRLELASFGEYYTAVQAESKAYVATLTEEEWMRKLPSTNGESPVAQWVNIVLYHNAEHTGEIAALKGVQGRTGLPF
jgi:hypothetical protein